MLVYVGIRAGFPKNITDNEMTVVQKAKPLYQVVEGAILDQIKTGQLKADEKIPSESELCRIFSVGRNTVRRAIQELVKADVLTTIHGVGTFVVGTRLDKTAEFLLGFTYGTRGGHSQVDV